MTHSRFLTAGACLGFVAFATARAVLVPLTYDEAATYLRYIRSDFLAVFSFSVATNHFVNTLLTKVFYLVGGDSELVLRLPNLIGYGVYLWLSILILTRLRHRVIAFAGFMLLNLNLYVLQYFSLSRGYGLSLAFLMGALFFLLRFVTRLPTSAAATRDLAHALAAACAAVMANFAMLNVYLGVFCVGLVALLTFNAARAGSASSDRREPDQRRHFGLRLPLVALAFTLLVFSQDIELSEGLSEPVQVTLSGLSEAELGAVAVSGLHIGGRAIALTRDTGATWRMERPAPITALRIELPLAAARKLGPIDVLMGGRPVPHDSTPDDAWRFRDANATRVLEAGPAVSLERPRMPAFRSIINWGGDWRYFAHLIWRTALVLSLLGALAVLLDAGGWYGVRAGLLDADQWRVLMSAVLWVATLAGVPVYLLSRGSQLYFGNTVGSIRDSLYSIIAASFYERTYHREQTAVVFDVILVTFAVFAVVLGLKLRRRSVSDLLPAICVLGVMAVATLASVAERFLFSAPYFLERTALFYIPLYVLFATFLCEAIAESGVAGSVAATAALGTALALSIYHFSTTANVAYTLEWRKDSGTKTMMKDLARVVEAERGPGSSVVLGVDWYFSAVADFYAGKSPARIKVVVRPSPSDFVYTEAGHGETPTSVIARYPLAGSVLVRAGPMR